jgi:hypothetical protein
MATMKSDDEIQGTEQLNELRACYNEDIDHMREREFPMLQGCKLCQAASVTKAYELFRDDLS